MKKITASIVTYQNKASELERAITSFLSSTLTGELFIIDNSPTPIASEVCKKFNCHYIFTGSNLGYGKAHNLAMQKSIGQSSYHLVLNPDVYFESDVLKKLFDFMEEQPQVGLVMPKVLYPNGATQRICKLLPTPLNLATRRFLPSSNWSKKINDRYEMNFSNYNKIMSVPFLSGCFMFLRTSALQQVGLFDERFFLYAEDTDLSRRMHREFSTVFYPLAEIFHTHARGSYKDIMLTWHNFKSAVQYFNKWGWIFDQERKTINEAAGALPHTSTTYQSISLNGRTMAHRSMNE
ncbi:glycosyltransferase family 2 protein [soil metagenome]